VQYQGRASWAAAVGRFPISYLFISRSHSRRVSRFIEVLIVLPAVYLALHQQPAARSIALMSLGRKRGGPVIKAIECDRAIRRHKAGTGLAALPGSPAPESRQRQIDQPPSARSGLRRFVMHCLSPRRRMQESSASVQIPTTLMNNPAAAAPTIGPMMGTGA